jgi:septal ring factor EnvC (AmiA/AmiB activator)
LDDYIKAVPELTMVEIVRDASLNDDIESLKRRLEKLEAERKHDKAVLSKILSELKRR